MHPRVASYLENRLDRRRSDAETLVTLLRPATRQEPRMWGSIVGFGRYHYR